MDQTKLKQVYSNFLLMTFPLSDGHKIAAAWIDELAALDLFYGNAAEGLITNKPLQVEEYPSLKHLAEELKKLQHEPGISEERYREYKFYLSGLDKLAKAVQKFGS